MILCVSKFISLVFTSNNPRVQYIHLLHLSRLRYCIRTGIVHSLLDHHHAKLIHLWTFLRGNCTRNPKLTCFAPNLKIVNTFLQNSKLSKELKNGIGISESQAVFKLWIKTVKILLWSVTQELLGLLKFKCSFWVSWTIYYKMHILFFRKVLTILR